MFGEPFDTDLDTAEQHLRSGDVAAALACYERLLGMVEGLGDCLEAQLLRAHLLASIGRAQLSGNRLDAAATSDEQAIALLRDMETAPMAPLVRQLWLDKLLQVLIDTADRLRAAGSLNQAEACLDEAANRLPEFWNSNGLRDAELGKARVQLLMVKGEWGLAEELALTALSTAPTTIPTVPILLTCLGQICTSTGRLDSAEDYFARAADASLSLGDTRELPELLCYQADVAWRRGDLDRAERLYTDASALSERRGDLANLGSCERTLGVLAMQRDDRTRAERLLAASLDHFQQAGMSLAAADAMLTGCELAYGRGDFAEVQRLYLLARGTYEAQGVYDGCAELDFLLAVCTEDSLNRSEWGEQEALAVDAAIESALPVALALRAACHNFATSHARSRWLELASAATSLVFRLVARRQDVGLRFELLEFHCAGAPLALDYMPSSSDVVSFPDNVTKTGRRRGDPTLVDATDAAGDAATAGMLGTAAGGAALDAAARLGLRIALPPKVLMSPGADRTALREYVEIAEARYHRRIVSEAAVGCWVADEARNRPVVQVRFADAGDLYISWRWLSRVGGLGVGEAPRKDVESAVAALTGALPTAGDGMRRVFESGAMAAYDTEARLARMLAEAFWPPELTEQLRDLSARGARALIRIQPSPRVAQVPWELLALDEETRLIDLADVVTTAPLSLRRTNTVQSMTDVADGLGVDPAGEGSNAVVLILDPKVPGYPDGSSLGSVLGQPDPALIAMVQHHLDADGAVPPIVTAAQAFRRADLDRDWLGTALRAGPRRLMYVGHVTQSPVVAGQSEDAQLHLCCDERTYGLAEAARRHRPLSAKDLFLGTLAARADGLPGALIWPAPSRVALIGCESGGDLRFAEPFGLASAMIHNGAELVTATRWVLPTSHAFHRLGGVAESIRPLSEAIIAVDAAHDHRDPIRQIGAWQRDQLDRWRNDPRIEHSPLLWAAMTSIIR